MTATTVEGIVNFSNLTEHDVPYGPAEPVLRIPFWYCKDELGLYENFEQSVHRTAKALKESYTYWPEGYVHVQTIINDEYVNMI